MKDSRATTNTSKLHPFEGMWLATKPSGAVACAKVINGELLIPYSFGGEGKLTGHYYDCRVIGEKLYGRFEQFDSAGSGVLFLTVAPNETLTGGRWMNEHVSEAVHKDISRLSDALPGMQHTVWVRTLSKELPEWAENIFVRIGPTNPPSSCPF